MAERNKLVTVVLYLPKTFLRRLKIIKDWIFQQSTPLFTKIKKDTCVIVAAILAPISVIAVIIFVCFCCFKNRGFSGFRGGSTQRLIGSFDCIETSPVCRQYFSSFKDSFLKDLDLSWHNKDQNFETRCPLLITSFTMSRVSDDVQATLKDLEISGNSVMLVVMQSCPEKSKPTRIASLENINDHRITAVVNVLIWNNVAYPCEINKEAAKEIKKFLIRKPNQLP
ncbi:uncharacterized protein LOC134279556 isoform X3 [Saccostrea cucullata]|uniref:uncharacterized protein LOC134279556 isoform X3 n=1 Tax=Saccostrea cuccullata TaxID=36930 RepID=UPI002ED45212